MHADKTRENKKHPSNEKNIGMINGITEDKAITDEEEEDDDGNSEDDSEGVSKYISEDSSVKGRAAKGIDEGAKEGAAIVFDGGRGGIICGCIIIGGGNDDGVGRDWTGWKIWI